MNVHFAYATDIGTTREINQDSFSLQAAYLSNGWNVLAVMCDGMGGLQDGEMASGITVSAFHQWFQKKLPSLVDQNLISTEVGVEWVKLLHACDEAILSKAEKKNIHAGTTAAVLLLSGNEYYTLNVGDTRIYRIRGNRAEQMTTDHTVAHREAERGNITEEQAETDERQNVLLQCIGAGKKIQPDISGGFLHENEVWLLCTDGFRHYINKDRISAYFSSGNFRDRELVMNHLLEVIDHNKRAGETDNMTGLVVSLDEKQSRSKKTVFHHNARSIHGCMDLEDQSASADVLITYNGE